MRMLTTGVSRSVFRDVMHVGIDEHGLHDFGVNVTVVPFLCKKGRHESAKVIEPVWPIHLNFFSFVHESLWSDLALLNRPRWQPGFADRQHRIHGVRARFDVDTAFCIACDPRVTAIDSFNASE